MNARDIIEALRRERAGAQDTLETMGKNMVMQPVAGYAGLIDLLRGKGLDAAANRVNSVQSLAGGPSTEEGAKNFEAMGNIIEPIAAPLRAGFDFLGEQSPALGAASLAVANVANPGKVVGAGLRGARAAGKAARAADFVGPMNVPALLENFGETKAAREAATARRVADQAGAEVDSSVRAKGAGKREKVDPRIYRDQYDREGYDAVLQAALRGEHLKPKPGGGYVGAPRTVTSGPQLGGMRRAFDGQVEMGVDALMAADPERVGDWYPRAKAAQAQSNEPYQLARSLDQHSVYSAGVAPETEGAFATKHHNSRVLGTGEMAYRGAGMRTLDKAVEENRDTKLAHKIGEYHDKIDPRIEETSPFGVNDFRNAQAHGYTTPDGMPWKAGVTDQMHPFMDAEMTLAVNRANSRGLAGKSDWTGASMQEIPWVLNKAEDIYGRGKNGRFADGTMGKVRALREANNTWADYLPKHAGSATFEYVPGANTGHVPQVADMPFEARDQYGKTGRWDVPTPETPLPTKFGAVGAGNRDALYSALGFRQLPAVESVGNYTNSLGQVEHNPMTIARPLLDFSTGTAQQVNPNTMKAMHAIETLRGVVDAQENMAANLPVTMANRKGKNSVLLDRGTPPTRSEMSALVEALKGSGMDATATNRGALVMNFADAAPAAQRRLMKQHGPALQAAMPGADLVKSDYEGLYVPAMSSAEEAGQGVATTRALQAFADAPDAVARNVGESESVRKIIEQKIARDEAMGGARPDIQKMRQFFSKADWPRAVEMMRKGMKPAAALAALGYSLQGMAAEDTNEPKRASQ